MTGIPNPFSGKDEIELFNRTTLPRLEAMVEKLCNEMRLFRKFLERKTQQQLSIKLEDKR